MLEFAGTFGDNGLDLCFIDMVSPAEWKNKIEDKLADYKEKAFIDDKRKLNLFVVLRLEPTEDEIDDIGYIRGHINEFMNFYYTVIREIKESE